MSNQQNQYANNSQNQTQKASLVSAVNAASLAGASSAQTQQANLQFEQVSSSFGNPNAQNRFRAQKASEDNFHVAQAGAKPTSRQAGVPQGRQPVSANIVSRLNAKPQLGLQMNQPKAQLKPQLSLNNLSSRSRSGLTQSDSLSALKPNNFQLVGSMNQAKMKSLHPGHNKVAQQNQANLRSSSDYSLSGASASNRNPSFNNFGSRNRSQSTRALERGNSFYENKNSYESEEESEGPGPFSTSQQQNNAFNFAGTQNLSSFGNPLTGSRGLTGQSQFSAGMSTAQASRGGAQNFMGLNAFRGLSANSFTGSRGYSDAQGPSSIQGSAKAQGLTESRGYAGAQNLASAQGPTANRGYAGTQNLASAQVLGASRGYAGTQNQAAAQELSRSRGYTGVQNLASAQGLAANRAYAGSRNQAVAQELSANRGYAAAQGFGVQNFAGSNASPNLFAGNRGVQDSARAQNLAEIQRLSGARGFTQEFANEREDELVGENVYAGAGFRARTNGAQNLANTQSLAGARGYVANQNLLGSNSIAGQSPYSSRFGAAQADYQNFAGAQSRAQGYAGAFSEQLESSRAARSYAKSNESPSYSNEFQNFGMQSASNGMAKIQNFNFLNANQANNFANAYQAQAPFVSRRNNQNKFSRQNSQSRSRSNISTRNAFSDGYANANQAANPNTYAAYSNSEANNLEEFFQKNPTSNRQNLPKFSGSQKNSILTSNLYSKPNVRAGGFYKNNYNNFVQQSRGTPRGGANQYNRRGGRGGYRQQSLTRNNNQASNNVGATVAQDNKSPEKDVETTEVDNSDPKVFLEKLVNEFRQTYTDQDMLIIFDEAVLDSNKTVIEKMNHVKSFHWHEMNLVRQYLDSQKFRYDLSKLNPLMNQAWSLYSRGFKLFTKGKVYEEDRALLIKEGFQDVDKSIQSCFQQSLNLLTRALLKCPNQLYEPTDKFFARYEVPMKKDLLYYKILHARASVNKRLGFEGAALSDIKQALRIEFDSDLSKYKIDILMAQIRRRNKQYEKDDKNPKKRVRNVEEKYKDRKLKNLISKVYFQMIVHLHLSSRVPQRNIIIEQFELIDQLCAECKIDLSTIGELRKSDKNKNKQVNQYKATNFFTSGKGRIVGDQKTGEVWLEAMVDIPKGKHVFFENVAFFVGNEIHTCSTCGKYIADSIFPCATCDEVVFCDYMCYKKSVIKNHSKWCGLKALVKYKISREAWIVFQILLQLNVQYLNHLCSHWTSKDNNSSNILNNPNFRHYLASSAAIPNPSSARSFYYFIIAAASIHKRYSSIKDDKFDYTGGFLENAKIFAESLLIAAIVDMQLRSDHTTQDKTIDHTLLQHLSFNLLWFFRNNPHITHVAERIIGPFKGKANGNGFSFLGLLATQSCNPNLERRHDNRSGRIQYRTRRDIKAGERFTLWSGGNYKNSKEKNTEILKLNYQTSCNECYPPNCCEIWGDNKQDKVENVPDQNQLPPTNVDTKPPSFEQDYPIKSND